MITKDQYEEALRIVREYEAQNTKPPKIVQAPEGCKSFLTVGMNYEVVGIWSPHSTSYGYGFKIINDSGEEIILCIEKICAYLNGGNWIIVEREP